MRRNETNRFYLFPQLRSQQLDIYENKHILYIHSLLCTSIEILSQTTDTQDHRRKIILFYFTDLKKINCYARPLCSSYQTAVGIS